MKQVEEKTKWEKRKAGATVIALLVVALDILALALGTITDAVPIALSIGCIGVITFVGVLLLTNYLSHDPELAKKEMRKAIAASFTMVYLIFLALIVFGETSPEQTELAKSILGHFTGVVGAIITFYFGSRFFEERRKSDKGKEQGGEEVKPQATESQDGPTMKSKKTGNGNIAKGFFKVIDSIYIPLEKIWHILTSVSPLTDREIQEASKVFPAGSIRYGDVRKARGRLLKFTSWLHKNRLFVTFRTINIPPKKYPDDERHEKPSLVEMIHELTHVYQFEVIGSIYMYQALRAQKEKNGRKYFGYKYGEDYKEWEQLELDYEAGNHFCDYNREQQAEIAMHYYKYILEEDLPEGASKSSVLKAYEPFIEELKKGEL